MKLRKITADCNVKDCPAVYVSDLGTVVFQGLPVAAADGLRLGDGEQAVELPMDVVREALPKLQRRP